jgi:hypothetical protein
MSPKFQLLATLSFHPLWSSRSIGVTGLLFPRMRQSIRISWIAIACLKSPRLFFREYGVLLKGVSISTGRDRSYLG